MKLLALALAALSAAACTQGPPPPQPAVDGEKVIYRVGRHASARVVLTAIEGHLQEPGQRRIAVLASGSGVRLLVAGEADWRGEAFEPMVRRLAERGIEFYACGSSLDELKIAPTRVLPSSRLVQSTEDVAKRLRAAGYAELR
jgi:intracellular sulfur oxidation DsrE/DsrF family protein